MSGNKPTPRTSSGALLGQGGRSRSLGVNDPRLRRGAQALQTDEFTGAFLTLDEVGRVTIDYAAIRARLAADGLGATTTPPATVQAGDYLRIDQQGRVSLDYDVLLQDLRSEFVDLEGGGA